MNANAISVERVSKLFRIPLDHSAALKYRLSHPLRTSRYRTLRAVDDVSFDVARGEFLGIAGPNGCGKSTLLKMLSRIYPPDRGRITVRGRVSPFLELGVGFNPELTARENIFLGGAVLGLTRRQISQRVERVLEFADLQDFADQKLRNFSSGMAVRLAFSVAIQADAQILLMDEVLAVGDAEFQEKCFAVFAEYKRQNRTVVLVSHDLDAIERYCDRALLLRDGGLLASGPPSSVTAKYRRMVSQLFDAPSSGHVAGDSAVALRSWSGSVEILSATVIDTHQDTRRSFAPGDSLSISVQYLIKRPVGDFEICLFFRRDDGTSLASPQVRIRASELGDAAAGTQATVAYNIPSLALLAGTYHLAVSSHDAYHDHEFHRVEDILDFRVIDDRARRGVVELGGTWSGRWIDRAAASHLAAG